MSWLLRRFGRSRDALICYLRENGPIAYRAAVFGRDPRQRANALLAMDLAWYWRTIGTGAGRREWTRLTAWSFAALLADIADATAARPAAVALIGVDNSDAPSEVDDRRAAEWMRRFDSGDGPLHAVIACDPIDRELVFVAQHPPEAVVQLLQAWGIDRDRADRQAYARLRERSLGQLARSLANERRE